MRLVRSSSAGARLKAARRFLARFPSDTELLVIAATRGAADEFARDLARGRSIFGVHRFSFVELAARVAALDGGTRVAGTGTNAEAMAARVAFDAIAEGELAYFSPVARMPGFPRALARTLHELRLAGAHPASFGSSRPAGSDLARLLARVERELDETGVNDRAALFARAREGWQTARRWRGLPVLLLDVPLNSAAERSFGNALVSAASDALVTYPGGDEPTRNAFGSVPVEDLDDDARADTDLGRLRRYLFMLEPPAERERTGDVRLFSAPGEGREAIEIARRMLDEAASGVRFDEMAVCLRAPQAYLGLLEHALTRAGVPAFFERGTTRPDPAGRAFVALLSCASERLSARRFDEYLSLGQVPRADATQPAQSPAIPDDEAYARFQENRPPEPGAPDQIEREPDSDDRAIIAGTLRAPWKWEELIVESAVIGGVSRADGRNRWRRRLDGLKEEYEIRIEELEREEPESPRIYAIRRDLNNLAHLRSFALPIIDELASWPDASTWGEWLDRFAAIAPRVLVRPARVLRVLAELRPMEAVGPVPLEEARDVLQDRLLTLDWEPAAQRYGRVFIGTPHHLRGRAFRVVFVPGLAERVFPQRVREDPLLPDAAREAVSGDLATRTDRTSAERLFLRLAVGAATDRLYLSYPRNGAELGDMRPRVPSFYALDVMRAITGRVPDHRSLAHQAAKEAGASLAWPAPDDPARAIDDFEHDLAVLRPLFGGHGKDVRGHARYLLELNPALQRSVRGRYARGSERWSGGDGLIRAADAVKPALAKNRLGFRPYSVSALQRFASCPYQFLLAAIHRLEVWEEPQPVVRMDPLTRGSLFHRAQAEFLRTMQDRDELPVIPARVARATETLHAVLEQVAGEYAERLAPAIERVWREEIAELGRDLDIWVERLSHEAEWIPEYFEFSFGLNDEGRDPRSLKDPVHIDGRFMLRGSVDLVERRQDGSALRVTDHKTGRNRVSTDLIVGGGKTLQPVIYSLAIEQALSRPVSEGRLYFCTTAGGFATQPVPMSGYVRQQGLEALTIIDRAIEMGRLPAAPERDACRWCDFRPVCGPDVEKRSGAKPSVLIADLTALRELR
jgi:hypothetical protein